MDSGRGGGPALRVAARGVNFSFPTRAHTMEVARLSTYRDTGLKLNVACFFPVFYVERVKTPLNLI